MTSQSRSWLLAWSLTVAGICHPLLGQDAETFDNLSQPEAWSGDVRLTATASEFLVLTHGNILRVEVEPASAALRAQLGIETDGGVVVTSVAPDGPAAEVGVKAHDIILNINDQPIETPEQFHDVIATSRGQKLRFAILRRGRAREYAITVPESPSFQTFNVDMNQPRYRIGVTLAEADETLRRQLELAAGEGLVVTDVVADGPAARAGIERHDVLVKLDNQRLTSVEKLNSMLQQIKDRKLSVVLIRGGQEITRDLTPQLSSDSESSFWLNSTVIISRDDGVQLYRPEPIRFHWQPIEAPVAGVAEQIGRLKQQMAEMQSTVKALEVQLQSEDQDEHPAEPQDE